MQVREISNRVFKTHTELEGFTDTDFFQIWKSYEQVIQDQLLEPELPYLQFLKIGTFYISNRAFSKKINNLELGLNKLEQFNIENPNYEQFIENVQRYLDIINKKIKFYLDFFIYLDGIDTEKVKRNLEFYASRIKKIDECIERAENLIKEYDKRIIARDLEKQSENSGGNQELSI